MEYVKAHAGLEMIPLFKTAAPVFINQTVYANGDGGYMTLTKSADAPLRRIYFEGSYIEVTQNPDGSYSYSRHVYSYRLELCSVGVWLLEFDERGVLLGAYLYSTGGGAKG